MDPLPFVIGFKKPVSLLNRNYPHADIIQFCQSSLDFRVFHSRSLIVCPESYKRKCKPTRPSHIARVWNKRFACEIVCYAMGISKYYFEYWTTKLYYGKDNVRRFSKTIVLWSDSTVKQWKTNICLLDWWISCTLHVVNLQKLN